MGRAGSENQIARRIGSRRNSAASIGKTANHYVRSQADDHCGLKVHAEWRSRFKPGLEAKGALSLLNLCRRKFAPVAERTGATLLNWPLSPLGGMART